MKYQKDNKQLPPLRLLGKRVFISLRLLPFISMFKPIALALATLRNPPGMIYPRKVFKHLKRVLLQRSFTKKFLKNDKMAKFLLRGFQYLYNQKQERPLFPQINNKITAKFNLNCVKTYLESIQQYENEQHSDGENQQKQKITFIQSILLTLQKRRQSDFNSCLRIKRVLKKLIRKQKMGNLGFCEKIYQNEFLKIRIPWTENIYSEIKTFGEQLWTRYKNKENNLVESVEKQNFLSSDESIEINDDKSQERKVIEKRGSKKRQKGKEEKKKKKIKANDNDEFLGSVLKIQQKDYNDVDIYFSSFECDEKK